MLAAATSASAVTRKGASKKALAALGSKSGSEPVVVFGLTKPLRAGTRVSPSGKVGNEGAFFFYEDSGPSQPYPHSGRVALVGAKSGKVKVSKTFTQRPRVNGKLPAFLTTPKRYRSSKYRVFSRSASAPASPGSGPVFGSDSFASGTTFSSTAQANTHPKADDQTQRVKRNTSKTIVLTGSDADEDLLTFEIFEQPDHGTLSGQPPDVTYTPDTNYLGKDKFAFKTNDGTNVSNTAHVSINVVPVGLPPIVVASLGCTAYTEQTPAVVIDGSLTVSDADDPTLDSAKVRIPVDPPEEGEDPSGTSDGDELLFTDQNGITGSYDHLTGTLSLTGTSSVANYQAALRSVRYRNLSDANPSSTRDVEFTVNDAGSDSAVATKQICISEGDPNNNSKPIGETSEGSLDYIENDGPVSIDPGFFVLDADSLNLQQATIKFTESQPPEDEEGNPIGDPVNNFAPAEDELTFPGSESGITGEYDDVNGIMTLSGPASVEEYEAAIRSVTYENVSEDPSGAPRTIRFQVTDSLGANSVPSNRGVLVTPVNDAPVATTSAGAGSATGSDPIVVVDSEIAVIDVDDDDLESARVRISSGSEAGDQLALDEESLADEDLSVDYDVDSGELSLTGPASVADYQAALRLVEYRHPGGNPGGTKTIEFVVNDGDLDSDPPATKDIEVNDAPVLDTSDEPLSYTEDDGADAVDSGITADDADSPELVGATVEITGGYVEGEDTLALGAQDDISGEFDAPSGILTLTGTATVEQYQAALADVRYENTSQSPSEDTRTVTFQADDGGTTNNLSAEVTRDVTVTSVNDAPVLDTNDEPLAYSEGDGSVAADSGITAVDVDSQSLVSATVQITVNYNEGQDFLVLGVQDDITGEFDAPSGTLTLSGPATVAQFQAALADVRYDNVSDDPSEDTRTLTFQADDGEAINNLSVAVTRDITVAAVNDAPTVTTTGDPTPWAVGDPATTVDAGVTVSDLDDGELASAEVRIAADDFVAGDQLELDEELADDDLAVDFFPATGILTVTGAASVADYQTALSMVKYQHVGPTGSASKTIEFKVNDGTVDSDTAFKEVEVTAPPASTPPVIVTSATPTTYTLGDTEGVEVDPGLTVADIDDTELESGVVQITGAQPGDELLFTDQNGIVGSGSGTGVLTLTGTDATLAEWEAALRSVKYRYTGTEPSSSAEVTFTVNDGDVDSNTASKVISIDGGGGGEE